MKPVASSYRRLYSSRKKKWPISPQWRFSCLQKVPSQVPHVLRTENSMRNLDLFSHKLTSQLSDLQGSHSICVDVDTDRVYAASDKKVYSLNSDSQQIEWQLNLEEEYLPNSEDKILNIEHLPDIQSICLATSNGDVLLYNTIDTEIECVGTVESGLTNMCWSPDQELLVLTTGASTVILMTREFEPVTEASLHSEEFGEQTPVNVGWGKKETQFHGTAGKQAAKQTAEEAGEALPWDDKVVRISWRGDGEYFVTSAIHPNRGFRQLKMWNRECNLQYTSEEVNGLEQALDWRPSGSLIVSSQRLPNRHDIVFFEKNGLRHGEFTLPFKQNEVKVLEVLWNLDSTILAVWLEDLPKEGGEETNSYVQLWTMSNYHWYLKQSLHFRSNEQVTALCWDPEPANRLHLTCVDGSHLQYTWRLCTNTSGGLTNGDHGWVAVIDGCEVLVTPFRHMVVPPPMSAFTIQLPSFVNQVVWGSSGNSNDLAIIMHDYQVAIYRSAVDSSTTDSSIRLKAAGGNGFKVRSPLLMLQGIYSLVCEDGKMFHPAYSALWHHFTWCTSDTMLAVAYTSDNTQSELKTFKIPPMGSDEKKLCVSSSRCITGQVVSVAVHPESSKVAFQLSDGEVVNSDGEHITKLPFTCIQIAYCSMQNKEVILGMTDRYRFYLNESELASDVTSFVVHSEFLLLTTHSHTCKCVRLNQDPDDVSAIVSSSIDENVRKVERGSKIVTAVADDTKVILQMPRGNLETIHPRALVLSEVKKFLGSLNYGKAFDLVRRHRISMNILYDHNPEVFLDKIDHFVCGLEIPGNINLFVADLKDEDTCQTMYSSSYLVERTAERTEDSKNTNKIDSVCDALRLALERIDESKYFLSTLTCLAKKKRPELELVLEKINNLRHQKEDSKFPSVDEALNYILYLVDVNTLYDVALGTYDFDLVIMVAEKSQKDPKEYLPFLNNLRKLTPHYQRYSIDCHLKRYHKALHHISKMPDRVDEMITFIKEQGLYSTALQIFPVNSDQYKTISQLYGNHLIEIGKNSEAGLIYSMGGHFAEALEVYKKIGYWQEAVSMAKLLKQSTSQIHELARSLAVFLKDHRRGPEAAVLYLDYCDDPEEAVVALLEAAKWQEAIRVIYKHGRLDLLESNLKPAVVYAAKGSLTDLESRKDMFMQQKQRLATIRLVKQQQALEFGDEGLNEGDNDLYSETSSITGSTSGSVTSSASQYSQYSQSSQRRAGRSAKNRRKAERKRYSLKEGSPYEDIALLEALGGLVRTTDELREEVKPLLRSLVAFNMTQLASQVQRSYADILKLMEKSITEIWELEEETSGTLTYGTLAPTIAALKSSSGAQKKQLLEEVAFMVPPKVNRDIKWKLKILEEI